MRLYNVRDLRWALFFALLICVSGCNEARLTEQSGETEPASPIESAVLKQDMIDASFEIMKAKDPDLDRKTVAAQVQNGIEEIREIDPEFLIVSAKSEAKLSAGKPLEDSTKRIAEAEQFLSETGIQTSGLVQALLPQYKAGALSPVRTELLAQLVVAEMEKAKQALAN